MDGQMTETSRSRDKQHIIMVHLHWMIRRDMPEVLEIEKQVSEYPWDEDAFVKCLRRRNCTGMVAEYDDRVVGFMIYELGKRTIHVWNFCVAKDFQRQGVGIQMIVKLKGKLSFQRRVRIVLEVRESNLNAQLFFRANKFLFKPPILRRHFKDTDEDAYRFKFRYRPEKICLPTEGHRIARLKG